MNKLNENGLDILRTEVRIENAERYKRLQEEYFKEIKEYIKNEMKKNTKYLTFNLTNISQFSIDLDTTALKTKTLNVNYSEIKEALNKLNVSFEVINNQITLEL